MRLFKVVVGAIILILLSIVVVQNPDVFWEKKSLKLDLWVWRDQSPEIAMAVYFLTFFLVGFLGSYFSSLAERFRTKKTVNHQQQTILRLEKEVQSFQSPPEENLETDTIESEDTEQGQL